MRIVSIQSSFAALAALAAMAISAHAQGDFSKVEIKTNKVSDKFYTLDGQGGTIGVLTGPDGVLMVDTQFAPLSDKIAAAVKKISNGQIRFVINTHVHGDHTGGDANFGKMGATIFARGELRDRLAHPAPGANGAPGVPMAAPGLPMVTYSGPVTFHMNGEEVDLIPIPHAHTDGDTLVVFPNEDVIMTGDFFRSLGFPNIDRGNGGSLDGMIEGLGVVIGMAGPNTKIIPGHGDTTNRAGVIAQHDMMLVVKDRVAKLVQQGKTLEEVMASKPTSDFDAKVPEAVPPTLARFIGQVYAEVKAPK